MKSTKKIYEIFNQKLKKKNSQKKIINKNKMKLNKIIQVLNH